MEIKFGEHWLISINGISFHVDTILTAWLAMLLLIVLGFVATRGLKRIPSKLQSFAEIIMNFIENLAVGQIGKEGRGQSKGSLCPNR